MAEVLGVVAAIAQLGHLGAKFGLEWKDAPDNLGDFIRELEELRTILSVTYLNVLTNGDFKSAFEGHPSALLGLSGGPGETQQLMANCEAQLRTTIQELERRARGSRL